MGPSFPPSGASVPPKSLRPRRPWYLTVALALAWLVGAVAILMSVATLSLVHMTPDQVSLRIDEKSDLTPTERDRQREAFQAYVTALGAANRRVVPLAVAELVLGGAMVVFAQRATAGRPWARKALVQLTLAHVALSGLEWLLTPDLRAPEEDFQLAFDNLERKEKDDGTSKLLRMGFGLGLSVITVVGLTLRGSRAYYGATQELPES